MSLDGDTMIVAEHLSARQLNRAPIPSCVYMYMLDHAYQGFIRNTRGNV